MIWCNVHQRDHIRCATDGGIMVPCQIVDLTGEAVIAEPEWWYQMFRLVWLLRKRRDLLSPITPYVVCSDYDAYFRNGRWLPD